MSVFQELWSEADQEALDNFDLALDSGKLVDCLLAIERATDEKRERTINTLSDLGQQLVSALSASSDVFSQASALAHLLADEFGLRGDTENYFAAENNYLSYVLENRKGQPISVSSIWVIVAQSAGINLSGVGLPQHFVVRLGDEGVFLDPFSGGAILSKADCKRIVHDLSDGAIRWSDRFLETVSVRDICERVLRNLCNSFSMEGEDVAFYRTVRFHAHMRPDLPQVHMLLGRLSEDFGDFESARGAYNYVIESFADHDEARIAAGRLKELGEEPTLKN